MSRFRKPLGTVAAVIAAAVAFVASQHLVRGLFARKEAKPTSREFLVRVADEINKSNPRILDEETELTTVTGLEGVLVYNYRLLNKSAGNIDGPTLGSTLRPRVTNAACANSETRDTFLAKGVTLRYWYADKAGAFVTTFDVTPKDCGL